MTEIHVIVTNRSGVTVDDEHWRALALEALVAEGVAGPAEMGLNFVSEDEMTELNEKHMQAEGPTDVLAFPIDDEPVGPGLRLVGDVVICPAVAARGETLVSCRDEQSSAQTREIALLTIHGVLHLLGHDHAEANERELMQQRETALLDRLCGYDYRPGEVLT